MTLSELPESELKGRLWVGGLTVRTGPFSFRIVSKLDDVAQGLRLLYSDSPVAEPGCFADFTVELTHSRGLRRLWRPQVKFAYDGTYPFIPLPVDHAFPLMEWAMNWCISTQAHQFLTLHAAVIERDGFAAVMPAPPGSGKSTLCAGLVSRNWRLLSDELALISLADHSVFPLCRPVSLKNQSISVIGNFAPQAVFNKVTHDTSKGSVSHMKARAEHVRQANCPARPRWIIFPKYVAGAPPGLSPRSRASSMLELGRNSFNYPVLGLAGFDALSAVISSSECFDFTYSQLEDAVTVFDDLAGRSVI